MKRIKIIHVAQAAGGVDRYLQNLFQHMNRDKFENILICSQDYKIDEYQDIVDNIELVKMNREISAQDLLSIYSVRKIVKRYSPDIVYAHSSKAGAITRIALLGLNIRCLYNPHGWSYNMRCSKLKRYIYILIERMAAPFCDRIICISDAEKRSAIKYKICKPEKLEVIWNGIDLKTYCTQKSSVNRESFGIPKNAFVVGMVGRISPQKAPDIFIQMAKIINEEISNSYFIIVGNGELESKIKNLASILGLTDRLLITGWVDNPMDYIKMFDVACLLSRWEGFGLVLPEYMIAQKPIVATNVDAIPGIIKDKENGFLVPVDDSVSAAKAVIKIYKHEECIDRFVERGLADVKSKFNIDRVCNQHEEVFINLIDGVYSK